MDDQAPAWNVPSTDGGSRWHHKILPVTSKGELKEHHRGLSMTAQKQALSTSSIQAGVYSVGLQTVRRSPPEDYPTHSSRMQIGTMYTERHRQLNMD